MRQRPDRTKQFVVSFGPGFLGSLRAELHPGVLRRLQLHDARSNRLRNGKRLHGDGPKQYQELLSCMRKRSGPAGQFVVSFGPGFLGALRAQLHRGVLRRLHLHDTHVRSGLQLPGAQGVSECHDLRGVRGRLQLQGSEQAVMRHKQAHLQQGLLFQSVWLLQ